MWFLWKCRLTWTNTLLLAGNKTKHSEPSPRKAKPPRDSFPPYLTRTGFFQPVNHYFKLQWFDFHLPVQPVQKGLILRVHIIIWLLIVQIKGCNTRNGNAGWETHSGHTPVIRNQNEWANSRAALLCQSTFKCWKVSPGNTQQGEAAGLQRPAWRESKKFHLKWSEGVIGTETLMCLCKRRGKMLDSTDIMQLLQNIMVGW